MDQPKIERLLRLMKLLTLPVNYTIDEIAERLGMSRRTVYRYIDTLKGAGFAVARIGDSFHILKEDSRFNDIEQLVHFSEEESFMVNSLLDALDDTNMLKQNLKRKLASVYNSTSLADCVIRKENAANTHELIRAIEKKQQVILRNYASSNSGDVRDRLVEPFSFTTNYIQVWCYEPQSGMNKQFRVSRIGAVEASKEGWQYADRHRSEKSDVFRTGGTAATKVKLKLGVMAKNLLLEEYPLAERDLTQIDNEHWLLDTDIYRPEGVGRFVIGLANDIEIVEGESIKTYLKEFMTRYCKKIVL